MTTQMCSINQFLHTTDHYLVTSDHSRVQFESQYIMTFIREFCDELSGSENLGQQPEETLTINNSIDYNLCALMKIS
jgi:hypothetical protein